MVKVSLFTSMQPLPSHKLFACPLKTWQKGEIIPLARLKLFHITHFFCTLLLRSYLIALLFNKWGLWLSLSCSCTKLCKDTGQKEDFQATPTEEQKDLKEVLKLIHLFIFFPCHTFQSFGSRDRSEGAASLSSMNPCYSHLQKSKKQEEIWRGNLSQMNGGGKQRNYWEIWWWKEEMTERKRESWRKGEQSREKSKAFCNEPWLRNSTTPSVRFHFVSVPPCIFSSSRLAVITLSCRTSRKKKEKKKANTRNVFSSYSRWLFSFPISDFRTRNAHSVLTFPFMDSLCCCSSIRRFDSTRRRSSQQYTTLPVRVLDPDENKLCLTVRTVPGEFVLLVRVVSG